jgi:ATP-dependent helicase/nuclease subunit A
MTKEILKHDLSALQNLTDLQNRASDPNNSAWVFASAGSGKTKILTDRVLRLLLEQVSANKILCLTFTKAGAGEMQERIDSELSNWVIITQEQLIKKLEDLAINPTPKIIQKARTLFAENLDNDNKISIQTIHSFCQTILKTFPLEAKVPLNFELIQETQSKFLLQKARQEVFKNAQNDQKLQKIIAEIFYQTNEGNLEELINSLISKKNIIDDLQNIFGDLKSSSIYLKKLIGLDENLSNDDEIIHEFSNKIDKENLKKLCIDLEFSGKNNLEIKSKIEKFLQNPQIQNFNIFCSAFLTQKQTPRKISGYRIITKKTNDSAQEKLQLSDIYEDLSNATIELINKYQEKLYSIKVYNNTYNLLYFVDNIINVYNKLKLNNSLLDYHDLIIKTASLLENPDYKDWIKLKMDGSFDHILIDESQDTNIRQWQIIIALCEDFFSGYSKSTSTRSIFIVGDEKQSIYSFQGSQPDISSKIYNYFSNKLGDKLKKIELNNSFRSTKNILDFVDKIFCQEQYGKAICKIGEYKNHYPIRLGQSHIEFWENINHKNICAENLQKLKNNFNNHKNFTEDNSNLNNEDDLQNLEYEFQDALILAEIIAKKINHWVKNKRLISGKNIAINFGDIMILLRKRVTIFPPLLSQALNRYNIPFSSTQNINFKDSLIIQDLLSVARFCCLKEDDFNLIHLLKSPFFNFNEQQILSICQIKNQQNISVFEALKNNNIYEHLKTIINFSKKLTVYEFYYFLINQQNFRENFVSRFGISSLEILDKFLLKLTDFSKNTTLDLQLFLELVEKIDPQIKLDSFAKNSVKITTIHSAKGLESPIVIIPDCNINPYGKDNNILWSDEDEISFPIWCTNLTNNFHELLHKIKDREKSLSYEENLRLLYVALTRARDEIYLASYGNRNFEESWYEIFCKLVDDQFKQIKIDELIEFLNAEDQKFIKKKYDQNQFQSIESLSLKDIKNHSFDKIFFTSDLNNSIDKNLEFSSNSSKIKGILIHKILEIIGNNYQRPLLVLNQYCAKLIENTSFLDLKTKNQISEMIAIFLKSQHFKDIFNGEVKCEIEINFKNFFARIDLLVFKEDEILIIDYKSDKTIPELIPMAYQEQLKKYFFIVQNLYRNKKIRCAILWINDLKLQFCDMD